MAIKKILIIGIGGFIGRFVSAYLAHRNFKVWGLSRNPEALSGRQFSRVKLLRWNGKSVDNLSRYMCGSDVVLNLAGENIGSGLWSRKKKAAILLSRVNVGEALTQAVLRLPEGERPAILQASAVGFYGSRGDEILDEQSPKGSGFLPNVVEKWEHAVEPLLDKGLRVVMLRFGVVWAPNGGALPRMLLPFRMFVGGNLGNGAQFMPWIHYQDLARAIEFFLRHKSLEGIFNITAPNPIRNSDFAAIAGQLLRRPGWLALPAWLLRLILKQAADEMLLSSQRVLPRRLLEEGFTFDYPDVKIAIQELLNRE
jgi:uncharacterized protein (TIGR01777 family)